MGWTKWSDVRPWVMTTELGIKDGYYYRRFVTERGARKAAAAMNRYLSGNKADWRIAYDPDGRLISVWVRDREKKRQNIASNPAAHPDGVQSYGWVGDEH